MNKGYLICAPGRIRTFVARRREIYSLLYLTTLPPTHLESLHHIGITDSILAEYGFFSSLFDFLVSFMPDYIWYDHFPTDHSELPMEGSVASNQRSFHETIVDHINQLPRDVGNAEIVRLFQLIMRTAIPANHDAIVDSLEQLGTEAFIRPRAWTANLKVELTPLQYQRPNILPDYQRTLASVREQKEQATLRDAAQASNQDSPGPLTSVILTTEEQELLNDEPLMDSVNRAVDAVIAQEEGKKKS